MSLAENFCSSPWFHMQITANGKYQYCRWARPTEDSQYQHPLEFFQQGMGTIRQQLLAGELPQDCEQCKVMEKHNKVSGRQRQLLKTGIVLGRFEKTLVSSTFFEKFKQSHGTGSTDLKPVDWQIHLGNFCNSGCVFCTPDASSRLAQEFVKLKIISTAPRHTWTDDTQQIDQFIELLANTPNLAYLHFIGGETLITPAFGVILQRMIDAGVASRISIGFTTNLTVWRQEIVDLLVQFREVNLGMSVECLDSVNDYVRWPSQIITVQSIMDQWIKLSRSHGWITTLRVTPTCLTVSRLLSVYQYAYHEQIGVESCNFLEDPAHLRINVLPLGIRNSIADSFETWIAQQSSTGEQVINTRDPNQARDSVLQDAASYVNYLRTAHDETHRLADLIRYLKLLETSRNNSVLNYLPEYEELFRTAGY